MSGPTDPLSEQSVGELLQQLVRIPSINPSVAPDEGTGETAIATFARDWLGERGVSAWLEETAPGRPNVVAETGSGESGRSLAFCAHIDTVGVRGMTDDPFDGRLEEGRIYGRGSYDMKGGVAAAMAAAAALAREQLPGKVLLALVADEEFRSSGAEHFVAHHPTDACIVTEPSEGRLVLAHKGFLWVEVVTHGQAAHGSRWDLGVSAIAKMGSVIEALERLDRDRLRRRGHALVGPASLHCARIEGGTGISTYAPECRLEVERRTLPGEEAGPVLEEIRRTVAEADPEARVELLFHRPPSTCDREAPVASCVREAGRAVLGRAPDEAGVGYWMDAAIFVEAGIPTVDYGPGGAGAHAAVEWVDLSSVVSTAQVLAEAARSFCRHDAG